MAYSLLKFYNLDRSSVYCKITKVPLQNVLLGTKNPDVLKTFSKSLSGFAPCEDSEYDFVRKGMKRSEGFFSNSEDEAAANTDTP